MFRRIPCYLEVVHKNLYQSSRSLPPPYHCLTVIVRKGVPRSRKKIILSYADYEILLQQGKLLSSENGHSVAILQDLGHINL